MSSGLLCDDKDKGGFVGVNLAGYEGERDCRAGTYRK